MDLTQSVVDLFCHSFPEIDIRVIKATVLEYGNDVEGAINDLVDSSDQTKDTSFINYLKVQCSSILNLAEEEVKQSDSQEEKPQVAGLPLTNGNIVPAAFDLNLDGHSACFVKCLGDDDNTVIKSLAIRDTGSETPDNSITIANVASSLECNIQEARTDNDIVVNLIKEVNNLRAKADLERIAAQSARIEAARGGEDLLMKASEVNKHIQEMKQENLKLSWEIHGEKAVLALEAEELKVRLEQVKQQKEKAVTTLQEVRAALQSCHDTAIEDRKRAEEDRQLKEEMAGKVLKEEERLMARVVQESKTLKMEAEACASLRDFLVDHGNIVDSLQREINNLCEDVKYLKGQVQDVWSSFNSASNRELVQHSGARYCSKRSNSTLSATSSQDITERLSNQFSASAISQGLDADFCRRVNGEGDGQYVHSVSNSFDGVAENASIGFMPSVYYSEIGSRGNLWERPSPLQEHSFLESSYESKMQDVFSRYSGDQQHHALGERGDNYVDSDRYGYPHVASSNWSSKIDNGDFTWRNRAGDDFPPQSAEGDYLRVLQDYPVQFRKLEG